MTGVNANGDVNVFNAKNIGEKIIDSMTGNTFAQFTYKRNDQAITLHSMSSLRVDGEQVQVDPDLLFQSLIVASNVIDDKKVLFRFEMCSYPSPLFDNSLMMRAPQKSVLADATWSRLPPDIPGPTGEVQHVLDGGALLHRIQWPQAFPTYREICTLYCDYVSRYFGSAIVVFDGYRSPSTKHMTHQRRTGGKSGVEVSFNEDMKLTTTKDIFLANVTNKQNLIDMLSRYLQLGGCVTHHAQGDADLLIAHTAVQSAASKHCSHSQRH